MVSGGPFSSPPEASCSYNPHDRAGQGILYRHRSACRRTLGNASLGNHGIDVGRGTVVISARKKLQRPARSLERAGLLPERQLASCSHARCPNTRLTPALRVRRTVPNRHGDS